jgi:hypothetical protein
MKADFLRKFYIIDSTEGGGGALGAAKNAIPGMAIVNGIGGLIGGIFSLGQKAKANMLLANLKRPTYNTPQEIVDNQAIAKNRANTGLPAQQYAQAMQNIERQRNAAINTLNTRRSVLAGIGKVQQGATDATLGLDVADAKQKIANEQGLMKANTQLANFKDKEWDWNKRQKYIEDYNYGMGLLGSGNQNLLNSIDKIGAGAGYLLAK